MSLNQWYHKNIWAKIYILPASKMRSRLYKKMNKQTISVLRKNIVSFKIRETMWWAITKEQQGSRQKRGITCSWHQKMNSPIHEFKVLHIGKPKSLLKPLYNGALVLIYYFQHILSLVFFILKSFCSTLNSWIREFVFWCHEQVIREEILQLQPENQLGRSVMHRKLMRQNLF